MTRALVAVDLQEVFADPSSPWATPRFDDALDGTLRLAEAGGFDAVVATRFVAPERPSGAWLDYYREWPFALVDEADPLFDLVPRMRETAPAVVTATTFGKWGVDLARATGDADELVVTGVSTDCCVLSTVLGAADAGRRVTVASDACAGVGEAEHERALAAMALYEPLVTIATVDEILGLRSAGRAPSPSGTPRPRP